MIIPLLSATMSMHLAQELFPPTCCTYENYRTYTFMVEAGYHIKGEPTSAVAEGIASSFVIDIFQTFASGPCVREPLYDGVYFGTPATNAVNLLTTPLSLTSFMGGTGHNYGTFGQANVSWNATSGSLTASAKSGAGTEDYYEDPNVECIHEGFAVVLGLGTAIAQASGTWTFSTPPLFSTYAKVTADSQHVVSKPCCETDSSPLSQVEYVHFVSLTLTDFGGTQVLQGVYAGFDDGSVKRLGFFESPSPPAPDPFAPTYSGNNYVISTGEVTLPLVPTTGATTITLASEQDTFGRFDGDIDASTITCGMDRQLIHSLFGTAIHSTGYTPRADFDLNGIIDANDLVLFNGVKCSADLNCNGMIDVGDHAAFQNAFAAQDPIADMDGNGSWDVTDFVLFQNAAAVGCS